MSTQTVLYFAKGYVMSAKEVDEFSALRVKYPKIRALNSSVSGKFPKSDLAFGSIPQNYKSETQIVEISENVVDDENETEPVKVAVKPFRKGFKKV